jgi:tetratricopeptide (TPR) repeat protein
MLCGGVLFTAASFCRADDASRAQAFFADGVKAYHAARYADAVDLNEKVLSAGYDSPAVYYNLANAYLRSGYLGRSLVNYLRMERLAPRDSDLRANLAFARSQVENYVPWPRSSIFAPADRFWSRQELQWIAFGAFVLAGTFFLAALYAGIRRKRIMLGVGLLGVAAIYLAGAVVFQAFDKAGQAVCVGRVEARFEPSVQATVYFKVPEGTELRVLREKDAWYKIERSDGKTGWVPVKSLERI